MAQKKWRPVDIFATLYRAHALVSQGQSVADTVRSSGVTEVTHDRSPPFFYARWGCVALGDHAHGFHDFMDAALGLG